MPRPPPVTTATRPPELTAEERAEALRFLRDPKLLPRAVEHMAAIGAQVGVQDDDTALVHRFDGGPVGLDNVAAAIGVLLLAALAQVEIVLPFTPVPFTGQPFAVLLVGRARLGWRGRKLAWFAVLAFSAVIFTYFGVSFLLPGLHSYAT